MRATLGFETPSDAQCKAFRFRLSNLGVANVTIRFSTKLGRGLAAAKNVQITTVFLYLVAISEAQCQREINRWIGFVRPQTEKCNHMCVCVLHS